MNYDYHHIFSFNVFQKIHSYKRPLIRRTLPSPTVLTPLHADRAPVTDHNPHHSGAMFCFYLLLGASQLLGVLVLILAGYWTGNTLGGFAWDGSPKEFNLHPLLMILGLVFLYGDGESLVGND